MNYPVFNAAVRSWAKDRSIDVYGTEAAQLMKVKEEYGEIWKAINNHSGLSDAIGDTIASLITYDLVVNRDDESLTLPRAAKLEAESYYEKYGLDLVGLFLFSLGSGESDLIKDSDDKRIMALSAIHVLRLYAVDNLIVERDMYQEVMNEIKNRQGSFVGGLWTKTAQSRCGSTTSKY